MLYSKKVKNSKIVETKVYSKKELGIKGHKQKILNYIWCVLLVGFTVVSKFVLNADELFVNMIIFLVIKIASMILLTYFEKSLFSKNHRVIYEVLKFINHFSKAMILTYSILAFFYSILVTKISGFEFLEAVSEFGFFGTFFQFIAENPGKFTMLIVNFILLNIEGIWFLIKYFKYWFFPVNAIKYFKWLFKNRLVFYEYINDEKDKDKIIENKREIDLPGYAKREFLHKIIISLCVAASIVLIVLSMIYL